LRLALPADLEACEAGARKPLLRRRLRQQPHLPAARGVKLKLGAKYLSLQHLLYTRCNVKHSSARRAGLLQYTAYGSHADPLANASENCSASSHDNIISDSEKALSTARTSTGQWHSHALPWHWL
jgi:hypothetical protein